MANPAYYELYGYSPEDVIGRSFALIFPPEQRARAAEVYRATFHSSAPSGSVEAIVRRADGAERTVEARYHFLAEDGRRTAMVSLVRDVTERKRLEEAQREFLAMVTHELRNPLAAIRGFTQLMRRSGRYDERAAQTVLDQTRHLDRLIGDLIDVASFEAGHLQLRREAVDLVAVAEAAVEQARAATSGHRICVQGARGPMSGAWDPDRLRQVLANLLSNAIKYSPDGGEILVTLEDLGPTARVSVEDHGIGIPPARLPHLFERFYRVDGSSGRVGGLGLGLAIARALVQAHGGRIWAASSPGRGSTFTFTLPYAGEATRAARSPELTPRQVEVATLVAAGLSNSQIAEKLVIAPGTVANHVEHILARLGFRSRGQVAVWAVERGLHRPGGGPG
jgi:PAS domain S-box-containing protein